MKIVPPQGCPSCSALLERVNAQLFCPNNIDCPAQTEGKLQNFCKVLKIKGFGEATLAKLDFDNLNDFVSATKENYIAAGFSEHMANKLVGAVSDRIAAGITISDFISALSIPLVGTVAASKLQVSKVEEITPAYCKSVGLGDKVTTNLVHWISIEWPLLKPEWESKLISSTKQTQSTKSQSTGISVCLTGKLDGYTRSEASTYLESLGVTVKSSVTKTVTYLICDEISPTSSSAVKAKQLNIPIITLRDLEEKLQLCQQK